MVYVKGDVLTNAAGVTVRVVLIRRAYGLVCQLLTRGRWVNRTWYGRQHFLHFSQANKFWARAAGSV